MQLCKYIQIHPNISKSKTMDEDKQDPPNTLVLAGGGMRGIALLGAIQSLMDQKMFSTFTTFIGTSVGAIIAYLLIIGFTPVEVFVFFYEPEGVRFMKKITEIDISQAWSGNGVLDMDQLTNVLEMLSLRKMERTCTLGELYAQFGKSLLCVTFNQTKNATEVLGHQTHGDVPCLQAIRMSCAIPFLFQPVRYRDSVYLDGGLTNNFPLDLALDLPDCAGVLGIRTECATDFQRASNVVATLHNLLSTMIHHQENRSIATTQRQYRSVPHRVQVVSILIVSTMVIGFPIPDDQKFDMFSCGYQAMRNFTKKNLVRENTHEKGVTA